MTDDEINALPDGFPVYKFRNCNPTYETLVNLELNNEENPYVVCRKKFWSLDSLMSNEFWAGSVYAMNDPFEPNLIRQYAQSQMPNKAFMDEYIKKMAYRRDEEAKELILQSGLPEKGNKFKYAKKYSQSGIFCLSYNAINPNLWALYADCAKGFAIEYDLKKLVNCTLPYEIMPITYTNDPTEVDDSGILAPGMFFYQKSCYFEKEEELRLLYDKVGAIKYDAECVKSIIFGINMPDEQRFKIFNKLKEILPHIKFRHLLRDGHSFKFKLEEWQPSE